jgi:N-acetylmuramoyl-L-alanine amidase
MKRVCIDPGHPSEVGEGTRGRRLTEIRAAWLVAQALKQRLAAEGFKVRMTKSREREFVRNRRRAEIANTFAADLMVRLHCDAQSGTGFATYYPDRAGRAADGTRGPSASVLAACRTRAPRFHRAFADALGGALKNRGLLPDTRTAVGGKQGALTGSIFSKVPVVLIEMCVLTNPADEAFLASAAGREALASALAAGVRAALQEP